MSHKYIIIHLSIIHLNNHFSQLIHNLVPHKPVTTLLTYLSNFSFSQATTASILLLENYALSHESTNILSPLYSHQSPNINLSNSSLFSTAPRYKTYILIVYYNVSMTCHAEFLRNINYVNSTYTITCLLFFTTRRAPTITRNTPNRYSNIVILQQSKQYLLNLLSRTSQQTY